MSENRIRLPFWMLVAIWSFLPACQTARNAQEEAGQLYTCGMHPQVVQEGPGKCSICGMNLTPLQIEVQTESPEHTGEISEERPENANRRIAYWRAPMDPTFISDKPGKSPMGMDLVPVYEDAEPGTGLEISIDPATVQNMGVRTATVKRRSFSRIVRAVGHIDYDEASIYNVNLKFDGWIETLLVSRTGDFVKRGQPLFTVYSPQLVATQQEYLLAYQNDKKMEHSVFSEIRAGSRELLAATRQRLGYWDITQKTIEKLEATGEIMRTLTIHSPASGAVIHKNAVQGTHIKAGQDLFRIADLSRVWVIAHVFEYELPWIQPGLPVTMELPYFPGKQYRGNVDYIYPYLDSGSRDVQIRLVFDNPDLELKPQMYANIRINTKLGERELVVPAEAIIRSGMRNLVFLALGDGKFKPREIAIGPEGEEGLVQVKAGLNNGDRVVTSAQFLLDSESRLRAVVSKMMNARP